MQALCYVIFALKIGLSLMHLLYVNIIMIIRLSFLACLGTEALWITKEHLPSLTGCIKVVGNLGIYKESFTGTAR